MPDCCESTGEADDMQKLKRMLCSSLVDDLDDPSRDCLTRLLSSQQSVEKVRHLVDFCLSVHVAKRKPMIAALAFIVSHSSGDTVNDRKNRQVIYSALHEICKIPTDLFLLLHYEAQFATGKKHVSIGRMKRTAIREWYNKKSPMYLALLVTKYKKRCGWSHKDVLRIAHVKPESDGIALVLKYVTKGMDGVKATMEDENTSPSDDARSVYEFLKVTEQVKACHDEHTVARLVEEHKLTHEHVPTWLMKSKEVWRALVPHMPMLALIKNITRLAALQLLNPDATDNCVQLVVDQLSNEEHLLAARIHPLNILLARMAYEKGQLRVINPCTWLPSKDVLDAFETAFYKTFGSIEASNKRFLLAIDASRSMQCGGVLGCSNITPLVASASMALIFARKESSPQVIAVSSSVQQVDVPASALLTDIYGQLCKLSSDDGRANCSLPMIWAAEAKKEVDVFVIYTDQRGGGNSNGMTPVQALQHYQQVMNRRHARLAIVTLTCAETTLADTNDPRVIHLAGFDASTPEVIRSFALGQLDSVPAG